MFLFTSKKVFGKKHSRKCLIFYVKIWLDFIWFFVFYCYKSFVCCLFIFIFFIMKKFLFLLSWFVLPLISVSNVFAQDADIQEIEETEIVEEQVDAELHNTTQVWQANLVDVYFWFCNDSVENLTESLNAAVELWKPFRVCLMIYNTDKENDAFLDVTFVNWWKNEAWYNVCWLTSLNEFITSWELWNLTIPADNYLIKEFEVTFPVGYDWEQHTCIGISSVDQNPQEVWWLKILARRAYYASFFVWWGDWLKNLLTVKDVQTKLDENGNLTLSFNVNNEWNMENSYEIEWSMKWLFNFQKDFLAVSGRVIPWGSEYVEIPLGSLPSYGWLFKINFTIKWTPYFSYDISNAKIDPSLLDPKTFGFSTSYFKMPWLIFGIVIVFLILIIFMFRRPKQKVVYVQQPTQQPMQQPAQWQQPQQSAQQYTQPRSPNKMQ